MVIIRLQAQFIVTTDSDKLATSTKALGCPLLPKVNLNSKFAEAHLRFLVKKLYSIFIFNSPSHSVDAHLNWNWTSEIHAWGERKYRQMLLSLCDISPLDNDASMGGFITTSRTFPRFFLLLTLLWWIPLICTLQSFPSSPIAIPSFMGFLFLGRGSYNSAIKFSSSSAIEQILSLKTVLKKY